MLLRVRITILVVFIILFVGVSFETAKWITLENSKERFEQSTMEGRSELWKQIVSSQASAMANNTSAIIRDRATRKALKNLDTVKLKENASTTYNLLQASGVISRLQITDVGGRVLYSSDTSFADKSRKLIIDKAISGGKVVSGIERDDDGKLLNVVAFPLSMRGKVIGAGVYAKDLSQAIAEFKNINNSNVTIISTSGGVDYVTDKEMFNDLNSDLRIIESNSISVLNTENNYYSVVNLPVKDDGGNVLASFITAKDFTESYKHQQSVNLISMIALVFVVLVSLLIVYMYMAFVLKPLDKAVSNLTEISEGNLSLDVEVKSNDEIGSLQKGMRTTVEKLRGIISQIITMTGVLNDASNNIGHSAASARDGVHKEQAELSQLTAAITEMTATVQEVARNASVAAESTEKADIEARSGQQLVQQTISSIQALATEVENASQVVNQVKEDSNAIGAILDVIRGIAEQTNLLALNAAIEAARAGEQGRGFAVVADEVRSLASRTQQSTQEIQDMIESLQSKVHGASLVMLSSQEKVNESVSLAGKSGDSLNVITTAVTNISDMNIQIATAAEQQASVSEEINRNAVNINQISENTGQGVEVIFQGTDQLADITNSLQNIVNKFNT